MAIKKNKTDKLGLGQMIIYMSGGLKTTDSAECSRENSERKYLDINAVNGLGSKLEKVYFNGKQVFPTTMNTKELSVYLPDRPATGTIRNWVSTNKIPYNKTGDENSNTYFVISEIEKWEKNGRK